MNTARKRIFYLDNLRAFLVVLVIMHHTAITYGAPGGWFYYEDVGEDLLSLIPLTLFTSVNQAFFMGLLFFIAGYFTPGSYDRKGASKFLKDRLIRLGVPIIFYIIFLNPFLQYQRLAREAGLNITYFAFWLKSLTSLQYIAIGPLWFLEALLIFSVAYVLWRKFTSQTEEPTTHEGFFKNTTILDFAFSLAVITWIVRLWYPTGEEFLFMQLGYFPQYIAFFIVGTLIYDRDWLNNIPDAMVAFWRWAIIVAILVWPVGLIAGGALTGGLEPFQGGLHWQSFLAVTWDMFFGVAMSIFLLDLFRRRLHVTGRAWKALSNSSYTMYIIHPVVVVALTLALANIMIFPLLKFALVAPLAVTLVFIISYFIRQLPYAKEIL